VDGAAHNIALPKCRRQNRSFQLLDFYCTLAMRRKKEKLRRCQAAGTLFPALRQCGNVIANGKGDNLKKWD